MNPNKKITLKTISEETGFSITTISHVINRTRNVDTKTKMAILQAVEKLGYTRKKDSNTWKNNIGLIVADIRVNYFYEIAKQIEETARYNDFNVVVCDSEENEVTEAKCIELLLKWNVRGLIIAPANVNASYPILHDKNIPVVFIDRNVNNSPFDFVGIDNMKSSYEATQYLIEKGFSSIAFFHYNEVNYTSRERKAGYSVAMREAGLYDERLLLEIDYQHKNSIRDIQDFIMEKPELEAALCLSTNISYEVLGIRNELQRGGNDLEIVSFDDDKWFEYLKHNVSAIRQPTGDIATVAVDIIMDKVNQPHKQGIPKAILLEYEFIKRS